MNFPHKSLTLDGTKNDGDAGDRQDTLIAHAIARQSLSYSARAVAADRDGRFEDAAEGGAALNRRIQLFAGQALMKKTFPDDRNGDARGHFWTGETSEDTPDEAATSQI